MSEQLSDETLAALEEMSATVGVKGPLLLELIRGYRERAALSAEIGKLVEDAAIARRQWAEEVVRIWWETWEPKPSHRYGHDFPAFLGERFLTDFDLRDIEPRNAYSPIDDAGRAARRSTPSATPEVPE